MISTYPVNHSLIRSEAILTRLLPEYDLGGFTRCRLLYSGVNDTYLAVTGGGEKYVMRIYRTPWRSWSNISYELEILNHLHVKGVAVARPLPVQNGDWILPVPAPEGLRHAVLFTFARGKEISYKTEPAQMAYSYGQAVGKLHAAVQDFYSPHARQPLDLEFLLDVPLQLAKPYLAHRSQDWEEMKRIVEKLHHQLEGLPLSHLTRGFVHGDLQGYHANVDEEGTLTFYDFDCCGPGFRAYDLAVIRWCSRLEDSETTRWEPCLRGYQEVFPLSEVDIAAIPSFVGCRYMWHIGLHTANADDWGHGWLNDEYFDNALKNLRKVEEDYKI